MKDSKEKENRISNLKNMFDHMNDETEEKKSEVDELDDIEEDEELINFLNEGRDKYEINDEYIYHPGKDSAEEINLEEESEIDEDFIIETDINEKLDQKSETVNEPQPYENEINDSFDNMINMKIGEKPILAIVSLVLGIIFIISSIIVFNAGTDRLVDNVVSGENRGLVVFLIFIGILLIIYGIYKIFNFKNPFESMFESMEENETNELIKSEEKEEPTIPKSNIPLDKESYKIGEFNMSDLKSTLKKPFSNSAEEEVEEVEEKINVENLPPAKEKDPNEKGLIKEEIEEREYEQARLDGESIDEIFADVENLKKEND
jgi:hypothetical protein